MTIFGAEIDTPETESQAAERLKTAFERVWNPMLIVDDQRRCVTANAPACGLIGIQPEEVPWHRLDDFTPAGDLRRLDEHWETFLAEGAIEGWYHLPLPDGRVLPVEFSATANVLPGRHLSVVMPQPGGSRDPEGYSAVRFKRGRMVMAGHDAGWATSPAVTKPVLTDREREVLGLVAGGLTGGEIAQQLVVSPETIKSHVQNAMTKLGAHTRAHAVAISLRDGQIDPVPRTLAAPEWERTPSARSATRPYALAPLPPLQ